MGKLIHLRPLPRLPQQRPPAPNGSYWTDAQDGDACTVCGFPFLGPLDGLVLWSPSEARLFCGAQCWHDRTPPDDPATDMLRTVAALRRPERVR